MILSHFSDKPISAPYSVRQVEKCGMKPLGLWISVDGEDDWVKWCEGEKFRDVSKQYHYKIELAKNANVLHLDNALDILKFTMGYSKELYPGSRYDYINWEAVSKKYGGIIIAPYNWDCRMHMDTFWYYPWDCASGCIWDHTQIAGVELVREPIKNAA